MISTCFMVVFRTHNKKIGSLVLTDYLRNMSHADFITLIRVIYQTLFNSIEGIQTQGSIFLDVIETMTKYVVQTP